VKVVDLHEFRLAREVGSRPSVAVVEIAFVKDDAGELLATLAVRTDPAHFASPEAFAYEHFVEVAALLLKLARSAEQA
jgi:hypothetical protein